MKLTKKKEREEYTAQISRKLSQDRMRQLLQLSDELIKISKTAEGEITKGYKCLDETISRLIVDEAKIQASTLPNVRQ